MELSQRREDPKKSALNFAPLRLGEKKKLYVKTLLSRMRRHRKIVVESEDLFELQNVGCCKNKLWISIF
jgi:hypothetical protein